ncbi:putative N-myristoyl transferase [Betaentomopoxvirus amoorei]|uniref:Putative glycylpeptide N-tetradecanoyltransferase n=1 Tax=Amsacta moorei entomopoxvirus TaxID=28321 RepID=NMT_AMEPV|nr:putative N-myristoyl transferase [Amsacta moorei entomopoxvirus]Q9EMI7.1 RecName: Full=Putative glycylpeptide N-tetradecanoyltransferase; AltName: Full=Myristoyl-CoA:protein N-myristoyltransferase; Short=NMT; AltName: Full=Peptide N-myristoyltransferase [Amsacta moorei entomopoxvirus]AAG02925.1 AMV219 [Amsacta moorei entomopoxvirus]
MSYWINKSICKLNYDSIDNIINTIEPHKPYNNNYCKDNFNIKYLDENNILDYYSFLYKNYNYKFNLDTIKWLLLNPFSKKEYNILLYNEDKIAGTISGIKKTISLHKKIYDCIHVTFLCIDKDYRNKYLHYFLIDEIMKNAKKNDIIIALFNSNIKFNNVKYINEYDTYITYGNKNLIKKSDYFNYELLNKKTQDLFFIYTIEEYNYWFNNNHVVVISYNNNFIALLKTNMLINKNIIQIFIIMEMYIRNNNIHKNYIPNNTIIYENYKCLKTIKLKSKLISYIYNYNFNNLSESIYLF